MVIDNKLVCGFLLWLYIYTVVFVLGLRLVKFDEIRTDNTEKPMRQMLREKIVQVCNKKIQQKGEAVGVSFYAF